jgi:hypothetical protein
MNRHGEQVMGERDALKGKRGRMGAPQFLWANRNQLQSGDFDEFPSRLQSGWIFPEQGLSCAQV